MRKRAGLRRVGAVASVVAGILVATAGPTRAFSGGITSLSFGASGCNECHSGGSQPTVVLTGPTTVTPGSTNEYTLQFPQVGSQTLGGLNVAALDGMLSTGGAFSGNTQAVLGFGGRDEITHNGPKAGVWGVVSFSFMWTAPASFTDVTLEAWGNAVDGINGPNGDRADFASLTVSSAGGPTATPTPSPTPGANACADLEPLKPFLVIDDAARDCQKGIAKAALTYTKGKIKAIDNCLAKFHKGKLTGDPVALCRGTDSGNTHVPPTDAVTAQKIADAQAKALATIDDKCTDASVAPLRACAETVSGVKQCVIDTHAERIQALLDAVFGTLTSTTDTVAQRCQRTLAKEGRKYVAKKLKAVQKCLNGRNDDCLTGNAAARCVGALVGGTLQPPSDAVTAFKLAKAEAALRDKVADKCTDDTVNALDACASTASGVADCLVCTHFTGAAQMLGVEYGGAERFADPAITLAAAIVAATTGETIMLDPGNYMEAVTLTTSGLQLIGQQSCDGARAELHNPGGQANGIFAAGADDLLFEGFDAYDYDVNDIFVTAADGVTFRDMTTGGPATASGTEYGVFPVLSNNVLVENCTVFGVRDAGIYVGQSTNIVVRNNEVYGNVAGIEIENSANAEVYGNHAHGNTGGILLFKLPGLAVQLSQCHDVHDNVVENNNLANYGSGTVGLVPAGTGILALSNDATRFRDNVITGNGSFGLVLTDQLILNVLFTPAPFPTPSADALVQDNFVTGNTITGNGTMPDPGAPVFADTAYIVWPGASGNCQNGNTVDSDLGLAALPPCGPPPPPGCPYVAP